MKMQTFGKYMIKETHEPTKLTYYVNNPADVYTGARVALVVKAGANNEQTSERGLSHFVEHMTINTMLHPSLDGVACFEAIDYAYTSFHETVYVFTSDAHSDENNEEDMLLFVERCIQTIKQILDGTLLMEKSLPQVRCDVIHECKQSDVGKAKALHTIFECENIRANLPVGYVDRIESFCFSDVQNYHKTWYLTENAGIIILGNISTIQVEEIISRTWFPECFIPRFPQPNAAPEQLIQNVSTVTNDTDAASIFLQLLSKEKRKAVCSRSQKEVCIDEQIEALIALHIVMQIVEGTINDYFADRDVDCHTLCCFAEPFSYDWYMVRFEFQLAARGFDVNQLTSWIQTHQLTKPLYEKAKNEFYSCVIERAQLYQTPSLSCMMDECIQNFVYDEPILCTEGEIKHISQYMKNDTFDTAKKIYENITHNLYVW